jgi:hypothetical protein
MDGGWMDKESALLLMNEHDMSPMLRVNYYSIENDVEKGCYQDMLK